MKDNVKELVENKIEEIISTIEALRGLQKGSINSDSRSQKIAVARQVVSNFLMNELNIKKGLMQQYINRDRTNFYFMQNLHKKVMDNFHYYPEYYKLYEQLKAIYYADNKKVSKKYMKIIMDLKQKKENKAILENEIQELEDKINIQTLKKKLLKTNIN